MGSIAAAHSAIQALYGSDSAQRQAANVWLTEYASSEQAWECMQLLQGDVAPEVQFFSVNLVISKVRHAWSQLQPDARQQIQGFARYPPSEILLSLKCAKLSAHASLHRHKLEDRVSNASNRLITQRLCLLLAAMAAADGAEAGAVLVNHAVQLTTGSTNGNQVSNPLLQAACTLLFNHDASLLQLLLTLVAIPVAASLVSSTPLVWLQCNLKLPSCCSRC